MTAVLILIVGLAIVAVVVGLMVWMDRVQRRRIQRADDARKAAGGVDPDQAAIGPQALTSATFSGPPASGANSDRGGCRGR
jgi:hypothetical protein